MTDIALAYEIAVRAHKGQVDGGGNAYIMHPMAVAEKVEGRVEKIVALLHDVPEDTAVDVESLRQLFGDEIADALDCLNHRKGEDYMDYIQRVKENKLAVKIKLADIEHNMDLSKLPEVDEKALKRVEKYKRALEILAS